MAVYCILLGVRDVDDLSFFCLRDVLATSDGLKALGLLLVFCSNDSTVFE